MFSLRQCGQLIISVTFPFLHVLVIFSLCIGISSSTVYPLFAFFVLFFFLFVCLFARFGDVSIVLWYYFFSVTISFSFLHVWVLIAVFLFLSVVRYN